MTALPVEGREGSRQRRWWRPGVHCGTGCSVEVETSATSYLLSRLEHSGLLADVLGRPESLPGSLPRSCDLSCSVHPCLFLCLLVSPSFPLLRSLPRPRPTSLPLGHLPFSDTSVTKDFSHSDSCSAMGLTVLPTDEVPAREAVEQGRVVVLPESARRLDLLDWGWTSTLAT